ncbi:MAG: HAD family hydrolase [Candidatus Gastranaerophilales bacterium]|nr:HAD family hydrolase [Candidatus Gastranaerophilales bacterium]
MINLKLNNKTIENIDTVLFDKDGTLIDLHYFWGKMSELRALEVIKKFKLNQSHLSEICLILGYDINSQKMLSDGITALYSRVKIIEIFTKELEKFSIKTTEKEIENIFDYVSEIFYKDILKYTKPINSAINFVKKLHSKGVKLGIVTSDSINSTNLTLKQFNWEELFKVAIGRESHPDTKESGKPTLLALQKLNSNSKNAVMIGDAPMDYISAKNAGIDCTILVATGQIAKEELEKTSNYCANSLDEIEILD